MSYDFDLKFSPSQLDRAEIVARLPEALDGAGIRFDGFVHRLRSRRGEPYVDTVDPGPSDTLENSLKRASSYWGFSLYCISIPLFEVIGKNTAVEVYVRVFKHRDGGQLIVYNEDKGAHFARIEHDLEDDLFRLMIGFCNRFEVELGIYQDTSTTGDVQPQLVPDLDELRGLMARQAARAQALGWAAIVSTKQMSLEEARKLAGPWASALRLAVDGYVIFPFLSGTPTLAVVPDP